MTWHIKLNKRRVTLEKLKSILSYNPISGEWVWIKTFSRRSKKQKGDIAGKESRKGYIVIVINYRKYYSHRLAWLYMTGKWPKHEIDHKDTNSLNNKWDNLREATHGQNQHNRNVNKNNKSGFKGVYFEKQTSKYRAAIMVNRKSVRTKRFTTKEEAIAAAAELIKLHGEFARTTHKSRTRR